MKRELALAAALTMGMVGFAHAAPKATYRWTDPSRIDAPWVVPSPATVSHVIYLNNCKPNGCTIHAGYDNSTTDTSSIPNGTATLSAYAGSDQTWQQIVQCVKQTYAPFNVQIVDTRPAAGTNFHEAMVAGTSAQVGEGSGVLGVSPFSCGYIPNSISFTFANEEPSAIYDLCWTVAQETAHSWGLDHKYDDRDPMTYLGSGPQMKMFQNQAGACGEYSSRQCSCNYAQTGSAQENSYQLIMATFGSSAPDNTPPTVTITSPSNNASVMPGFAVRADVNDDIGLSKAELHIDGMTVGTANGSPWVFNAPMSLSQGKHHVEVVAYDLSNNTGSAAIDVVYGSVCTKDSDCSDSTQVCSDGHCVAGPGTQGGLGTPCTGNTDCASGQCGDDGQGNQYCVVPCDPSASACPSSFSCVSTGATTGVCWPGDNGGGGGCNTGKDGATILVGLGFAAALITRRRR